MKTVDLLLMAPAIAFAGGLIGLIQHVAHPGDIGYLSTAVMLFAIGTVMLGGMCLIVLRLYDKEKD